MGMQQESYDAIARPGTNTGLGTVFWQALQAGVKAVSPTKYMQDANILHDKDQLFLPCITAPAAGAYPLFTVIEGIWQVDAALIYQVTAGTSITFDILWVASGTAIGSGTTQLTGTIGGSTAGNNLKYVLGTLIAAPTQAGPGQILGVNVGGTVTSFVGNVQVHVKRLA